MTQVDDSNPLGTVDLLCDLQLQLKHLNPLEALKSIDLQQDDCSIKDVLAAFETNKDLQGLVFIQDNQCCRVICRRDFLKIINDSVEQEKILQLSSQNLYKEHCKINQNLTIFSGEMQIIDAVEVCLQGNNHHGDRLIVVEIESSYYLLSFQDLLIAHTQLHRQTIKSLKLSNEKLEASQQKMNRYIQDINTILQTTKNIYNSNLETENFNSISIQTKELRTLAQIFHGILNTAITHEKELEDAMDQMEAIINAVPGGISWIDSEGIYIGVNSYLANCFNISPDEFIGKEVGFLHGRTNLGDFLKAFVQGPEMSDVSVVDIVEKNGIRQYYLIAARKYKQGQETVSIGIDITYQKRIEEALRITEEKYRSIFENAVEGIFQSSPEGRYIDINPRMAEIYGYNSPQEMIDTITDISQQIYVYSEDQQKFKEQINATGKVKNFEYRVYQKNGDIIWIEEDTRAVFDSHGTVLYYEGMVQDITERKYDEENLRRQLEELQIEIDQQKREKDLEVLVGSHYFKEIQEEISEINLDEYWS